VPILGAAGLHEHVDLATAVVLLVLGLGSGWLGAVVGIGGGIVIVPALVLGFGFDTKVAVAASLVAVVASSAAAGSAYVGAGQTNMRLALVLEIATTLGGLVGGLVAVLIAGTFIDGLFAVMMLLTALLVFRGRGEGIEATDRRDTGIVAPDASAVSAGEILGARVGWEERGHLGGAYLDQRHHVLVVYRAVRLWIGWTVSFSAGIVSGLLGVGGGFLKVPAMNLGMRVPIKVAAATSNFMVGVTAVASLFVYFSRGYVLPFVAAPIALGIAGGAYAGARSAQRFSGRSLGRILAGLLVLVAVQMGLKATGVVNV
jgi:uncharacterized membrane protein YfcA